MTCERMADLLDAYLDGETDALTARGVEEHLAQCAACSRQLAARRGLQQALREKMPTYRAPEALRAATATIATSDAFPTHASVPSLGRTHRRPWGYAVAAALALMVGLSTGYFLHQPGPTDVLAPMVAAVETDHLRSLQEGHLLDVVSTDQHTVKPWFAGRLAFSPAVPDLMGFPLKGGRLDWVADQQAVALVYGRNKHVINLFVWPGDAGLPAAATSRSTTAGHHVVCWSEGGLNYCAISDVEAGQLSEFAAAYRAAK